MTETVSVQPMQWKPVVDISDAQGVTEADGALLRDVRDVLKKHGALDRFGLTLIHRHFDIEPDECLLEHTDVENRTLVTKPVKKADVDMESTTVTHWKLTDGDAVAMAGCRCAQTANGHGRYHQGF